MSGASRWGRPPTGPSGTRRPGRILRSVQEREEHLERTREVADVQPERVEAQPLHAPIERLASAMGNRAFSSTLARSPEEPGILPDGTVHPDVESAIAQKRGSGTSLDAGVRERFSEGLGDSLDDVRVHNDEGAGQLAESVSARAFASGNDLFFGKGEYQPGSSGGDELLAHELTHVVQQRGAPESGPMQVSEPGDALEGEADEMARELSTS